MGLVFPFLPSEGTLYLGSCYPRDATIPGAGLKALPSPSTAFRPLDYVTDKPSSFSWQSVKDPKAQDELSHPLLQGPHPRGACTVRPERTASE